MKKGFTLIELLAVVIILAVISLIATPIVLDVVDNVRNSANKSSANMVLSAAKNYYAESMLDNSKKDKLDGKTNLFYDLQMENKPKEGVVYINEKGNVALVLILNNKCYVKAYNTEIEEYSKEAEECDLASAIDETAPTVLLELIGGEIGNDNWYTKSPYIKVTVSDDVSGFSSYKWCVGLDCTPNNIEYENESSKTLTDSASTQFCVVGIDKAGNKSDKTCIDEIKIDTISPEISGIADITASVNEEVDLNAGVEVSDSLSEVEGTFITDPTSVDTKTTGTKEVKYTVVDKAGNKTEITRKVIISASAPTITYSVGEGIINEYGWASSDFYVTINVTDNTGHGLKEFRVCTAISDTCDPANGSIITDSTSATRLISTESNNNRICVQATDKTEQTSEVICSDAYKLDKTNPTVTYSVLGGTYNEYQTIRITPSDDNYLYMHVHVYTDNGQHLVDSKSFTMVDSKTVEVVLDGDEQWNIYTYVVDKAGNVLSQEPSANDGTWYIQAYTIDTTEPTLELSKETYLEEDFSTWNLDNSEIDSEGNLVLAPNSVSGAAYSPYYKVNGEKWYVKYAAFTTTASSKHDSNYGDAGKGDGGVQIASVYYNSNFELSNAQNGYESNGNSPSLPLNVWSNFTYNGRDGYGENVQYLHLYYETGNEYSQPITKIRNFKLYGQLYNDFYNITVATEDTNYKVIKYAKGEQNKEYFENNGTEVTTDTVRVTENGTYTFYIEDNAGNKTIKTIVIDKIDKTVPNLKVTASVDDSDTNQDFVINTSVTESISGYKYDWYKDGTKLSNTSDKLTIDGTGTYKVIVSNGKGNVEEKEIVINTYEKVAVDGKNQLTVMGTMNNGNTCVLKGKYSLYTKEIPYDVNTCTLEVANNLVLNGNLEYKSNIYMGDSSYDGNNIVIDDTKYVEFVAGEYIEVDPNKTYKQTMTVKASNSTTIHYLGMFEYDCNYNLIAAENVMYVEGSTTTLAQDLKPGDTIVYLTEVSGFTQTADRERFLTGFIFWDDKDCGGIPYGIETYSRNLWLQIYDYEDIDYENNTITLNNPWSGDTIIAGTSLSQSDKGSVYNYGISEGDGLPTEYTTYSNIITGINKNNNDDSKFRPGTKYIKPLALVNHRNGSSVVYFNNLSFEVLEGIE